MDGINSNLSQKEIYDLKKREKEKLARASQKKKITKRTFLWVFVVLLMGGALFGLIKLSSLSPSGQGAILIDAVTPSDWMTGGNAETEVVLVEYADFQCPACGVYNSIVTELLKEYEGEVSLVFRHFPLRQIHTNANLPSQATEAAGSQGKFWEMHDMIFEGQNVWSDQSQSKAKDTFVGYAQKINLDIERFERDMDSDEVKDAIEKDYQSGLRSQVDSTPTFFLNRQKIQPTNYENFKSIIDQAVAERSS